MCSSSCSVIFLNLHHQTSRRRGVGGFSSCCGRGKQRSATPKACHCTTRRASNKSVSSSSAVHFHSKTSGSCACAAMTASASLSSNSITVPGISSSPSFILARTTSASASIVIGHPRGCFFVPLGGLGVVVVFHVLPFISLKQRYASLHEADAIDGVDRHSRAGVIAGDDVFRPPPTRGRRYELLVGIENGIPSARTPNGGLAGRVELGETDRIAPAAAVVRGLQIHIDPRAATTVDKQKFDIGVLRQKAKLGIERREWRAEERASRCDRRVEKR